MNGRRLADGGSNRADELPPELRLLAEGALRAAENRRAKRRVARSAHEGDTRVDLDEVLREAEQSDLLWLAARADMHAPAEDDTPEERAEREHALVEVTADLRQRLEPHIERRLEQDRATRVATLFVDAGIAHRFRGAELPMDEPAHRLVDQNPEDLIVRCTCGQKFEQVLSRYGSRKLWAEHYEKARDEFRGLRPEPGS